MKWIVTGTANDPLYRARIGYGNATPEEARAFKHRWRTLDGDGEISFSGTSDRIGFAPLDDFARADVGDVEIQFMEDGGKYHGL